MKRIFFAVAKLRIRMQMRSAAAEIEAAERRIANEQRYMERLIQYRSELQHEMYWLEKDNFCVKGANA
jgi:hypothetical protein